MPRRKVSDGQKRKYMEAYLKARRTDNPFDWEYAFALTAGMTEKEQYALQNKALAGDFELPKPKKKATKK